MFSTAAAAVSVAETEQDERKTESMLRRVTAATSWSSHYSNDVINDDDKCTEKVASTFTHAATTNVEGLESSLSVTHMQPSPSLFLPLSCSRRNSNHRNRSLEEKSDSSGEEYDSQGRGYSLPFKKRRFVIIMDDENDIDGNDNDNINSNICRNNGDEDEKRNATAAPAAMDLSSLSSSSTAGTASNCNADDRDFHSYYNHPVADSVTAIASATASDVSNVISPVTVMSSQPEQVLIMPAVDESQVQSSSSSTSTSLSLPATRTRTSATTTTAGSDNNHENQPCYKRIYHPKLNEPLPNGCHGRTSRTQSYCRRGPNFNGSNYCRLHYYDPRYVSLRNIKSNNSNENNDETDDGDSNNSLICKTIPGQDKDEIQKRKKKRQRQRYSSNTKISNSRGNNNGSGSNVKKKNSRVPLGDKMYRPDTDDDDDTTHRCCAISLRGKPCSYVGVHVCQPVDHDNDDDENNNNSCRYYCNLHHSSIMKREQLATAANTARQATATPPQSRSTTSSPSFATEPLSSSLSSSGSNNNDNTVYSNGTKLRLDINTSPVVGGIDNTKQQSDLQRSSSDGTSSSMSSTSQLENCNFGSNEKLDDTIGCDNLNDPSIILLNTLSTDQWMNREVVVLNGPYQSRIGYVSRWRNGWVTIRIPVTYDVACSNDDENDNNNTEFIVHNRRSYELKLHTS